MDINLTFWEEMARLGNKAVIIIDMLNDFVTGDMKCERAKHIIPNLKKLIKAAHKHNIPVIYSNDAHYPEDFEVTERWGKHAIKGTKGAEIIPELKPTEKDYVVEKRTYSGFCCHCYQGEMKKLREAKKRASLFRNSCRLCLCRFIYM